VCLVVLNTHKHTNTHIYIWMWMGQQRGVLPLLPFTRYICMAGGGGTTTINPSTKHKILLLPPFPSLPFPFLSFPFLSFLISVWGDFLEYNRSLRDPGLPKPTNWLHVYIFGFSLLDPGLFYKCLYNDR
jgi:hypothetical protein